MGLGSLVDECFSEEKTPEEVYVNIIEPKNVDCDTLDGGSSGIVDLINGRKIIKCSAGVASGEAYSTPLIMELEYTYELELSKTITIQNTE